MMGFRIESPSLIGRDHFDDRHCRPDNIQPSIRLCDIPDDCAGVALVGRERLNGEWSTLWAFGWLPACVAYIPEGTIERLFGKWAVSGLGKYIGPARIDTEEGGREYRYEIVAYGTCSPGRVSAEEVAAFDGNGLLCRSNGIGAK